MNSFVTRAAMLLPLLFLGACVQTADVEAKSRAADATASIGGTRLQNGMASYYSHGSRTANGEAFRPGGLTAAHRTLPFGTRVRVVHKKTGKSVVVRINDRGPFVGGRVLDLSLGAAREIGMTGSGVAPVEVYALN